MPLHATMLYHAKKNNDMSMMLWVWVMARKLHSLRVAF